MKSYSIQGVEVWLMSVTELAKKCGVKTRHLYEWERKKILPRPTITEPKITPISDCGKRRLYTEPQAEVLVAWLKQFKRTRNLLVNESMIKILHDEWYRVTEIFIKTLQGVKEDDKEKS